MTKTGTPPDTNQLIAGQYPLGAKLIHPKGVQVYNIMNATKQKIKDIIAAMKKDVDPKSGLATYRLALIDKLEKETLKMPTPKDLQRVQKCFISNKLNVIYLDGIGKRIDYRNDKIKVTQL